MQGRWKYEYTQLITQVGLGLVLGQRYNVQGKHKVERDRVTGLGTKEQQWVTLPWWVGYEQTSKGKYGQCGNSISKGLEA